jgi:hypothetical protein
MRTFAPSARKGSNGKWGNRGGLANRQSIPARHGSRGAYRASTTHLGKLAISLPLSAPRVGPSAKGPLESLVARPNHCLLPRGGELLARGSAGGLQLGPHGFRLIRNLKALFENRDRLLRLAHHS